MTPMSYPKRNPANGMFVLDDTGQDRFRTSQCKLTHNSHSFKFSLSAHLLHGGRVTVSGSSVTQRCRKTHRMQ